MKLRTLPVVLGLSLTFVLATACASRGSSSIYQKDVGTASSPDLMRVTALLLQRFHYEIAETSLEPFVRFETHWRPRNPFRDEQALGVTNAESRIIVTGRLRSETDVGGTYSTRVAVENRVRVAGGPDWNESVNTPLFKAYADSISEEFRKEFTNIGVRRY